MVVGEFTIQTELAVIGAGPAGHAAALRAAKLGLDTILIDQHPQPGGAWIHGGGQASNELIRVATFLRAVEAAPSWGVRLGTTDIDLNRVRDSIRERTNASADRWAQRAAAAGVTCVHGVARFESTRDLSIAECPETPRIRFRRAIIATGTRARSIPGLDPTHPRVMLPAEACTIARIPETLLIVGGSTVAIEIAEAYATLGSRVTIAQRGSQLLPMLDSDLVEPLHAALERRLERVLLGAEATAAESDDDGVRVTFTGPGAAAPTTFDSVVIAVGREPSLTDLGLDQAQVRVDHQGWIRVDAQMQTSMQRILAAGDVTGPPAIRGQAERQGAVAAETAAGWNTTFDAQAIPQVVHTEPAIAWCGAGANALREQGRAVDVYDQEWAHHGVPGRTRYLIDPETKLILGVGIIGPHAGARIGEGVLAVEMGAVLDDVIDLVRY